MSMLVGVVGLDVRCDAAGCGRRFMGHHLEDEILVRGRAMHSGWKLGPLVEGPRDLCPLHRGSATTADVEPVRWLPAWKGYTP